MESVDHDPDPVLNATCDGDEVLHREHGRSCPLLATTRSRGVTGYCTTHLDSESRLFVASLKYFITGKSHRKLMCYRSKRGMMQTSHSLWYVKIPSAAS